MLRGGLVGEAIPIQRIIQPIPAPITGKNAARPIPTMCRRGEPKYIEPRSGIAEAWNRPPPVDPITILFPFLPCNRLSIDDQPGTGHAFGDSLVQNRQVTHGDDSVTRAGTLFCLPVIG